jgi:basic membrane protein A and related proteins
MTERATTTTVLAGLVAALALLAAGCGSGSDNAAGTTETTATTATSTTGTTPGKAIKVGLITDLGQLNDNGFNELAYNGLKRAERVLGIKGRVVESKSAADYVPNMTTLARQGYDLIIGVGFAQGDAIATTAKKFPKTSFAIVDVDQNDLKGKPTNVRGLLFREQEVGYLAGYLAALEAKAAGGKQVSAVGGFKEPPVDRYIAGYKAGAQAAVPGIVVKWGYSQDWDDQTKCKELGLNQIAGGSKVVFQVAGGCGLGALLAAKEQKVWGIGVDADQSFLGPHVLTSALKGVDTAVFLTAKAVQDGTFKGGGNADFGLDQDGVGLGKFSPKASKKDIAATKKVEQEIADGQISGIPTTVG